MNYLDRTAGWRCSGNGMGSLSSVIGNGDQTSHKLPKPGVVQLRQTQGYTSRGDNAVVFVCNCRTTQEIQLRGRDLWS
ncbi:MAG: hypothetical protein ABSH20_23130, partial [Tepidisphaeraceae bacterium]